MFLAGCWISWASVSLKKLSDTEPDLEQIGFRLSKYEISWMTCLLDLGNVMSPILACLIMNRIGRKHTLLLSSLIFCVPILFLAYPNIRVLYLARFSVGFAKGIAFAVLPLYISEISDICIRGTLVSISSAQMYVGLTVVLAIGPFISLKVLTISLCVVPFIFMILFAFIPESPYYLASVEKYDESKQSLKWFRCSDNVDAEYEVIVNKAKADILEGRSFKELFKDASNRRALFIVLVISGLQRLGGITSLIVFGPKTFPETSIPFLGPSQSSFILMLTLITAALTQFRLSDTIGRKTLLEFAGLMDCIMLLLMGIYFMFPGLDYSFVVYILLIAYGFCFNGAGCVPFILVGELFPMNTRCQASSLSAVFTAFGSFLTNKFHLLLVSFTNTGVIFWIYAFFNLLLFLFAKFFLFETKCKTFDEIQDILKKYNKNSSSEKSGKS